MAVVRKYNFAKLDVLSFKLYKFKHLKFCCTFRESEKQEEEMGTEVTAAASGETRESWEENPIDFHNNNVVQKFFRFIVHIQAFLSASF